MRTQPGKHQACHHYILQRKKTKDPAQFLHQTLVQVHLQLYLNKPVEFNPLLQVRLQKVKHQACHHYILQRSELKNPDQFLHQALVQVRLQLYLNIPVQFHLLIPVRPQQVKYQAYHHYILQRNKLKKSSQFLHQALVQVHLQLYLKIRVQFHLLIPVRPQQVNYHDCHHYILQRR